MSFVGIVGKGREEGMVQGEVKNEDVEGEGVVKG